MATSQKRSHATVPGIAEGPILDAALEKLARIGYDRVRMDDLAQQLQVSSETLLRYYPAKEHIIAAALVRLMRRVEMHMQEQPARMKTMDRLEDALRGALMLRFEETWPDLEAHREELEPVLGAHEVFLLQTVRLFVQFERLIERAKAEGDLLPHLSSTQLVRSLFNYVCAHGGDAAAAHASAEGEAPSAEALSVMLASLFISSIRARSASAPTVALSAGTSTGTLAIAA
jgi:AcrR family transcriptional regulator